MKSIRKVQCCLNCIHMEGWCGCVRCTIDESRAVTADTICDEYEGELNDECM